MLNKNSKTKTVNELKQNLIDRLAVASKKMDVLDRMAVGLSLGISEVTVKRYLENKATKMLDLQQAELIADASEKHLAQKSAAATA